MKTFFTSDHHFGHANIIKYSKRPFANVREMDNELIRRWNNVVDENDVVYYVGDFTLGDFQTAWGYFAELNGNIFAMSGSHDRWLAVNKRGIYSKYHKLQIIPALFSVEGLITSFDGRGLPIVLCHYAMRSWDRSHYGSWHLFGHHHGSMEDYGLSFDIGVDSHDFYPWSFEEVKAKMQTLKPVVDYSK